MEQMNTNHKNWDTFRTRLCNELVGAAGFDLDDKIKELGEDNEEEIGQACVNAMTKGCDNTLDKSRKVLRGILDISVDESITYLEDNGGYCDCEVIINIDNG